MLLSFYLKVFYYDILLRCLLAKKKSRKHLFFFLNKIKYHNGFSLCDITSFLIVFIIETVFWFHHNFVLETNLNFFIKMSFSSRKLILSFLLWYFIKMSFSSKRLLLKIFLLSFKEFFIICFYKWLILNNSLLSSFLFFIYFLFFL